jgi:hypothetical protein
MRRQFVGWAVIVLALAVTPAARGQIPYSYTLIAITGGTQPYTGLYSPSLNASGTAAFGANLTGNASGVFVGNGTTTTTIAQTGTTFTAFSDASGVILPAISPTSTSVAFFATRTPGAGGGGGIFRGNGATTTPIGTTPTFTTFNIIPAINSANTVSFTAAPAAGGQGVFSGTGGAATTIATSGTAVPSFVGPTAINSAGTVAFIANFADNSQQVLIGNGGPVSPIATTGTAVPSFAGPVSINGSAAVAFVGNLAGGGRAVFRGTTSTVDTIASTGTMVTTIGDFASINSIGAVAFAAQLSSGGQAIFTGDGATTNTVIQSGAALSGSTVQTLALGSFALNDLGQVAFVARLADGRQGVYVATPVPEAGGVFTIAAAVATLAGAGWRFRRPTFLYSSSQGS